MADNSYGGTFGERGYGSKSSEKLLLVKGKNFTREKNKRKRTFNGVSRNGGQIDVDATHSTKFEYPEDN
jgi:SRP40, C-terminal domain